MATRTKTKKPPVPAAKATAPTAVRFDQTQCLHLSVAAVVLLLGAWLYGFTLPFPFVFDDELYLTTNPLVKDFKSFGFFGDFAGFVNHGKMPDLDPDLPVNFIMRPVVYLTFFLNYALDGLNPRWFRLFNIAVHCANALLVFELLWYVLQRSVKCASLNPKSKLFIALFPALAFMVHPMQIESVTYIVQRFTSMGAFFFLLTMLTYFIANHAASRNAAAAWRSASVAALLLGMLSKENIFTAPFVIVMADWIVMGSALKTVLRRAAPHLACLPLIPALILMISAAQQSQHDGLGAVVNLVNYNKESPYHYALTQLSVVLTYLRLLVAPYGLNLDPDYPFSTSIFQARVLLSLGTIAAMVGLTGLGYRRKPMDGRKALLFGGVLWYFLTLGVDSSIVALPDVMAEHRAYLPSIGALLALACLADMLRERLNRMGTSPYVVPAGAALVVLGLCLATLARNEVWRTKTGLWQDTVAKSPKKARAWFNLAGACYNENKLDETIRYTKKVLELSPHSVVAHSNLATAENSLGNYQKGLAAALQGLKYAKNYELYYCAGLSYAQLGQLEKSVEAIKQSLALRPDNRRGHLLLGEVYAALGKFRPALESFAEADRMQPLEPPALKKVAKINAVLQQRIAQGSVNEAAR